MSSQNDLSGFGAVSAWVGDHAVLVFVVIAVLLVATAILMIALRTSKRKAAAAQLPAGPPEGSSQHRVERELEFIFEFIGEFSNLLTELETQNELRQIPRILVNAMVRIFRAEQAVVVVRRKATLTTPGGDSKLIVAALATGERGLSVGSEMNMGEGHLGTAAQCQQVLDRGDLERDHGTNPGSWPVFDVAAPLVANGKTLGAIGVARPHRRHFRDKDILRMVAQLGSMTWTNIAAFRTVKVAADVDELTGIFNKRSLRHKLSELLHSARQNGGRLSLYMFDIDNFKHYNDTNGHMAGDNLLRSLAQVVKETVRTDDIFGRFGGEEFMLILPNRSKAEATAAAENIRRRIADFDFPFGENQPQGKLTVSGGVATFPVDADDVVELIKAADAALYRAKDAGRNTTRKAETGLNPNWG